MTDVVLDESCAPASASSSSSSTTAPPSTVPDTAHVRIQIPRAYLTETLLTDYSAIMHHMPCQRSIFAPPQPGSSAGLVAISTASKEYERFSGFEQLCQILTQQMTPLSAHNVPRVPCCNRRYVLHVECPLAPPSAYRPHAVDIVPTVLMDDVGNGTDPDVVYLADVRAQPGILPPPDTFQPNGIRKPTEPISVELRDAALLGNIALAPTQTEFRYSLPKMQINVNSTRRFGKVNQRREPRRLFLALLVRDSATKVETDVFVSPALYFYASNTSQERVKRQRDTHRALRMRGSSGDSGDVNSANGDAMSQSASQGQGAGPQGAFPASGTVSQVHLAHALQSVLSSTVLGSLQLPATASGGSPSVANSTANAGSAPANVASTAAASTINVNMLSSPGMVVPLPMEEEAPSSSSRRPSVDGAPKDLIRRMHEPLDEIEGPAPKRPAVMKPAPINPAAASSAFSALRSNK